ncbi:MAG: hypothetical protein ACOVP2_01455 [Armatimonadaceae bacterium]|jgi:hypothetical protein
MECEIGSGQAHPEIHILARAKCGLVAGQKMLIPTLADIETALPRLPRSVVTPEKAFRALVAEPFGADGCCTFATNKALRAITERACAQLAAGVSQSDVPPFWRVVTAGSTIAKRLLLEETFLRELHHQDVC